MNTNTYKNINLESSTVRNKILQYVYSNIDSNIRMENVSGLNDLDVIRDNDYIICPKFGGTRSWVVFCKFGQNYYAVNFPKYHSKNKRNELRIYPIDISVKKNVYDGTIMEGIYFRMDNDRYLVIDEVYILAGQNQLLKPKNDRLNYLSQYTNINFIRATHFHLYISQYFLINKDDLKELYSKIKSDTKIQEIIFYPKIYGSKIYKYTILDEDLIDHVIELAQFRMQKTLSPDVYNLLSIESNNKIGIAYIPDIEISKKCKQWFKNNKTKELIVKCKMDTNKHKWIPSELVEEDLKDLENDSDEQSDDESTESNDRSDDEIEEI